MTVVCAAGNENLNIDEHPVFPACLPRPNVIAVGATDAAGRPATQWNPSKQAWIPFTNRGPKTVDVSAPGTLILAATGRGKADLVSGTSYAAAMVTAMKALSIRTTGVFLHPSMPGTTMASILVAYATDKGRPPVEID